MTESAAGPSLSPSRGPRISNNPGLFLGIAVLAAALGLQACETSPGPQAPGEGAPANSASDSPDGSGRDAGNARAALSQPRVYPAPSTLSGLDPGQVVELLGPPPFRRSDNPAEIWQYRAPACVLDLFLYRTGKAGLFRVRHFEARGRGKNGVSDRDCFHNLIRAHETGRSG